MANEEQLAILKQGVDVWNQWRKKNPDTEIDLRDADLGGGYNLSQMTDFRGINFSQIDASGANLSNVRFDNADLSNAKFNGTNFWASHLNQVDFSNSEMQKANFDDASLENCVFGNNDLSTAIKLEETNYVGPSTVGIDTIQRSKGKIPVEFLRGCGLSDLDIEYVKLANPKLSTQEVSEITHRIFELKDTRPIQISPLFISYSHANSAFVDKLETKLNENGIRFWRDIHDATAGRLERQIDRAIRHNPTVLLILSEHSTSSDWVEHEARLARKLEKELGRDVLCPIALDDSWETCNWPERIKEQIMEYNILDFSNWEDDTALDKMFKRLIDGLDMFYKK